MKRILCLISILLPAYSIMLAQKPHPCGTAPQKTEWLKTFQSQKTAYRTAADTLLVVPMTVHNVGNDDGNGHFATGRLLDAFCTLNEDFEEAEIIFYMPDGIKKIDNSAVNSHDEYNSIGHWMNDVADPNSINSFIVNDPNGNCGYNLFWSHMMVGKNCAGKDDHTWAHEAGHHFSLPHPFFGWEGGQTHDNSMPPNFSQPAPDYVTYNYSEFIYDFDTLAIDTAIVEKTDGSNCHEAGDGFCDTKPDYIANRWVCNADSESSQLQTDPNGQKFRSDGTLIMSYSDDRCARRFSAEQIAAMRAFLLDRHPDFFISPETPLAPVADNINFVYPTGGEDVPFNSIDLEWEKVDNATDYLVQVSRLPSFPINDVDAELADNFLNVTHLEANKTYYWRVRAYNKFHTCSGWSPTQTFKTTEVSAVAKINGLNEMSLYPNHLNSGESFSLLISSTLPLAGKIVVYDISGKKLISKKLENQSGISTYDISTSGLQKGMYLVGLETEEGKVFEKLIVR